MYELWAACITGMPLLPVIGIYAGALSPLKSDLCSYPVTHSPLFARTKEVKRSLGGGLGQGSAAKLPRGRHHLPVRHHTVAATKPPKRCTKNGSLARLHPSQPSQVQVALRAYRMSSRPNSTSWGVEATLYFTLPSGMMSCAPCLVRLQPCHDAAMQVNRLIAKQHRAYCMVLLGTK